MRELAEKIAAEMRLHGPMAFERFMELALYCPVYGYYEKETDTIGRRGDYFTSVSVGSLFGELLAFQFAEWLQVPSSKFQVPSSKSTVHRSQAIGLSPTTSGRGEAWGGGLVEIVEAGAHRGELARDILMWLRQMRPALFERLTYLIVEPSARRQLWQQQTLADFGSQVRWVKSLGDLRQPESSMPGSQAPVRVIFSNELLDAMPVQRFGWDAKKRVWFEWGVTLLDGRFAWARIQDRETTRLQDPKPPGAVHASRITHHASRITPSWPDKLVEILPDGFTVEMSPAAQEWWREAAGALGCGKLLTIDYGFAAHELFAPERESGTLRAYQQHRVSSDVLSNPGEQDLTAHVDFSSLEQVGKAAGLRTEAFMTQERFLTGIAAQTWKRPASFGEWTARRKRQFQTLTHPEHLGRPFRVLVQERI